jgi:hypothetical protein
MAKWFLYRFFGLGKFPKSYHSELKKEGVILQDEGLLIVIRYRKFRSPNAYYGRRVSMTLGSIVLTK